MKLIKRLISCIFINDDECTCGSECNYCAKMANKQTEEAMEEAYQRGLKLKKLNEGQTT